MYFSHSEQGSCGSVIRNLESKRAELIHKNLQIEVSVLLPSRVNIKDACESLEKELQNLKKRKLGQDL